MIVLNTFGTIGCASDGEEVALPNRSALLLVVLAFNVGKKLRRDTLADLLWETGDIRKSRHSLSQALYTLRKILPSLRIDGNEDWVLLSGGVKTDASDLDLAIANGDVATAVEIYRGGFIVLPPGSPRSLHEWRDERARLYEKKVSDCAAKGILESYNAGQWEKCVEATNAFAHIGSLPAELADHVRTARDLIDTNSRSSQSYLDSNHTFVGRSAEVGAAREEWRRVRDGETRVLLIVGEPGIGKTRLGERLARIAALEGGAVLSAACYEPEKHVAFAPTITAVKQIDPSIYATLPAGHQACLRSVTHQSSTEASENFSSKHLMLEAISSLVRLAAGTRHPVLWLDDFQWADDSTIEWVHYFVRTSDEKPAFVILCMRDHGIDKGTAGWLLSSPLCSRVEVGVLADDDARLLIDVLAPTATISRKANLLKSCDGHPFYIVAVSRGLAETGPELKPVPTSVHRLIGERVGRLSRQALAVAQTLSAAKTGLSIDGLLVATDMTLTTVIDALSELDSAKLLKSEPIDLSHDLIKQCVYESMAPVIRQLRHRQILSSLGTSGRNGARALHASLGALTQEAHVSARAAADDAMAMYAYSEALFFRKMALENAKSELDRHQALLQVINLLALMNRHIEARGYVEECAPMCVANGDKNGALLCESARITYELASRTIPVSTLWLDLRRLMADIVDHGDEKRLSEAIRLALLFQQHVTDQDELQRIFAYAERISAELSTSARSESLGRLSNIVAFHDGPRALSIANEAVDLAVRLQDPRTIVRALVARGSSKTIFGDLDGALDDFDQAEAVACDDGGRDILSQAYINRACIYFGRGSLVEARLNNEKAKGRSTVHDFAPILNEASACMEAGDYKESIRWADQAMMDNKTFAAPWVDVVALSITGLSFLALGLTAQARSAAKTVAEILERTKTVLSDNSYTVVFLSSVDMLEGNASEARMRLENSLDTDAYKPCFGLARIQIALAEILIDRDPDLAYHYGRSAANTARTNKSTHMEQKAKALLERIRELTS